MITYLLPTRDRAERLQRTLEALDRLDAGAHERLNGAQVIIVDNDSAAPFHAPRRLPSGMPVRMVLLKENAGAAARNIGAKLAAETSKRRDDWIVMLDDDSYPLDDGHLEALLDAPEDVAAIGAEIFLPGGVRESGGLPEVFIGCGVAIRLRPFLDAGGYDPTFDYYAEEYDLAAKFILAGHRIIHDRRFRVMHEKVTQGRDFNRIIHRLVRNNAWVAQRYAPPDRRQAEIDETISRYGRIAVKENAAAGYAAGVADLIRTIAGQPARTMSHERFDRFTGLAAARRALKEHGPALRGASVCIVEEGKNAWAVRQAAQEAGAVIVDHESQAEALVIGTLSPGPMLDACERRRAAHPAKTIIAPWKLNESASRRLAFVA